MIARTCQVLRLILRSARTEENREVRMRSVPCAVAAAVIS
jgi:hypothetical protein